MAITTNCPGCDALFNLPDDLAGQEVRCQRCERTFVVPLPPEFSAAEEPVVLTLVEPPKPTRKPLERQPPTSPAWALFLTAIFLFHVLAIGGLAIAWIVFNLGPPIPAATAPLPPPIQQDGKRKDDRAAIDKDRVAKGDRVVIKDPPPFKEILPFVEDPFDKDRMFKDGPFLDKKAPRPPAVPVKLTPGFNGEATVHARLDRSPFLDHGKWDKDGPYRVHKMQLQDGKTYNFSLSSFDITPRLQIFDGDNQVAERKLGIGFFPNRRVMLAFQPKRTTDYLILITAEERFAGGFTLLIAPENRPAPIAADLTERTAYTHNGQLRIEDPLDLSPKNYGPYREYELTLDADKDYIFTVVNNQFNNSMIPVLQIHEDNRVVEHVGVDRQFEFNDRRVTAGYRPPNTGKYRVRVTSKDFALGDYTLTVATKAVAVQTILASFDDNGVYSDQRELAASDPKMGARGHYKAYLIALEQGKKYRIEMTLKDAATSLVLFDPADQKVGDVTSAPLVYTAQRTGVHRLQVAAPLPKAREPYQLKITTP